MRVPRELLAQLFNSEGLESLDPAELRDMLAELDDQIIYGEDAIEVAVPA